jgi:4-amino-4-deoxy-L-arabinose transferase-like glycosyltransferase
MDSQTQLAPPSFLAKYWPHLALTALTLILFFANLGDSGMYAAQEGRAGIVVRNMVESGDYFTIQFKGHDVTEKPIFFYWLCLASYKIFGFTEFGIRFPAAASAALGVLLAYVMGRRIYGEKTGLFAALILATCISFVHFGRIARIDIVLGVAFGWTMYLLYRGYFEEMKANWRLYFFYVALGVCVLIKGPVAVALAGFAVVLFALVRRDWRIFWELKPLSGLAIGALITCPWFAYQWVKTNGEYTSKFLLSHNVERFLDISGTYGGGKRKPFLFYVPNLFAGALPWSIFLPFGAWKFWKSVRSLRPQTWFLLCWFLAVFIFFSLSAYKRPDYLTPLYPALAVLFARLITRMQEESSKLSRWWLWGFGAIAGVLAIALALLKSGLLSKATALALDDNVPFVSVRDAQSALQLFDLASAQFGLVCLLSALALGFLFFCCRLFERGKLLKGAVAIAALAFVCHLVFIFFVGPHEDSFKTLKKESLAYLQALPPAAPVNYCMVENVEELIFYIRNDYAEDPVPDKILNSDGKPRLPALVIRESVYEKLPEKVKGQFSVVVRTPPGHQYPTVYCLARP